MIWPPGALFRPPLQPTLLLPPPPLHSQRISGEVLGVGPSCLMHYPVPYIPPSLAPAGDLRGKEARCHVWTVFRILRVKFTTAARVYLSLHDIEGRPPGRADCPVQNASHCRSSSSTLLKWACAEKAGSTWKPHSVKSFLNTTQGHLSLPNRSQRGPPRDAQMDLCLALSGVFLQGSEEKVHGVKLITWAPQKAKRTWSTQSN